MMCPCETFDIGSGYSVEFTFDGMSLNAAWLPSLPPAKIGVKLLPAYREARSRFLERLAPAYGTIVVVDL